MAISPDLPYRLAQPDGEAQLGIPPGQLQDLVALLSGRNVETKQYEEVIAEESFARLKKRIVAFINKTHVFPFEEKGLLKFLFHSPR